jgi:hypothetical protein
MQPTPLDPDLPRLGKNCSPEQVVETLSERQAVLLGMLCGLSRTP